MFYNVSTLLQEPTGSSREYDIDDEIELDGVTRAVTGHVRLDRTPRGVLVRARIVGSMEEQCSRCLGAITLPIEIVLAEEFVPVVDIISGARVDALEGEEDSYRINARHELDLREAARQYWSMTIPMAPLCRDDCPGLCPVCGNNNTAGHACGEAPVDNRWAKLAQFSEGSPN
jgi:uncharacterized protein